MDQSTGSPKAVAVERGCGRRVMGGVYAECGLSADGLPLETFIADPPIRIDVEALGLSPIGVTLHERDGVTHIFDWVGSSNYPNVADFIEEVRRFGASRRLPRTLDFGRITKDSRIILIHAKAIMAGWPAYAIAEPDDAKPCPKPSAAAPAEKRHPKGGNTAEQCARFWYQDVQPYLPGTGTMNASELAKAGRKLTRRMPSFEYEAHRPPSATKSRFDARYAPGIFMSLPLHRIAVINDPKEKSHIETMDRAKAAGVPVEMEDE